MTIQDVLGNNKTYVIARAYEHYADGELPPEAIQLTEHSIQLSADVKFLHFRLRALKTHPA